MTPVPQPPNTCRTDSKNVAVFGSFALHPRASIPRVSLKGRRICQGGQSGQGAVGLGLGARARVREKGAHHFLAMVQLGKFPEDSAVHAGPVPPRRQSSRAHLNAARYVNDYE